MIALALLSVLVSGPPVVHTAIGEAHACLPIADGVLVATSGGLVELDGELHVTRVRTALDGLPGTRVDVLFADGESIWAGTEQGLAQLDGRRVVKVWTSPPVRAVARFGGKLYIGTWGGGLFVLEGDGLVSITPATANALASRVTSLAVVGGELYIGTAGAGVMQLRSNKLISTAFILPNPNVWALANHRDRLAIGTLTGLVLVEGTRARTLNSSDTRAIVSGDALYLGTYGDGLSADDRPIGDTTFIDGLGARGDALCAVGPGALHVREPGAAQWRSRALEGLPSNDIATLVVDGERVVIGTFDQGLALLEGDRITRLAGDIDPQINALIVEPGTHRIWVGTARGVFVIDGRDVRRIGLADGLPDEDIHAIAPLAAGGVVIGTGQGAVLWRDGHAEVIGSKQGLPGRAVWALAEDRAGRLWLGTSVGLIAWRDGQWDRYSVASGHLADDWVTALVVDDSVWVGTYAGGVSRLSIDANNVVQAQQLGGGHINLGGLTLVQSARRTKLYAATMEGLQVYTGTWTTEPTLGVDVTSVVAVDDTLWVATRRGLSSLN